MKNILMTRPIVLTVALFFSTAQADQIDCTSLNKRSGIVENEICKDSKLNELHLNVDSNFNTLKNSLTGEMKDTVTELQNSFELEKNDCQNESARNPGDLSQRAYECLNLTLSKYLDLSNKALKDHSHISDMIKEVKFASVPFVLKHGSQLIGKPVSVLGTLSLLKPVHGEGQRLKGNITDKNTSLEVHFKSMSNSQAQFIDANHPRSHHRGIVEASGKSVRIYLTEVLGTKLP